MIRKAYIFSAAMLLVLLVSACSASATPVESTREAGSPSTQGAASPPLSEAEVPRVSIEDARAALESGAAIMVDVRSDAAYEASHIAGAINIQLGEFESNPSGTGLATDEWIITYCT